LKESLQGLGLLDLVEQGAASHRPDPH